MASAQIFVDDAVRGRLPKVCAKTGAPANRTLRVEQECGGGIGAAWLLVLLGPLGWIIIVVLLLTSGRGSTLTVRLPISDDAVDHDARLRRERLVASVCVLGCAILGVVSRSMFAIPQLFAVAAVVAFVVAVVMHVRVRLYEIPVELDASGRWIMLRRVHPDFVRAVDAWSAERETIART